MTGLSRKNYTNNMSHASLNSGHHSGDQKIKTMSFLLKKNSNLNHFNPINISLTHLKHPQTDPSTQYTQKRV